VITTANRPPPRVDYDNDGDLDLFVVNDRAIDSNAQHNKNRLFENDGNGVFTDVAASVGVDDTGPGYDVCK
jgi:hypothetical protein